MKPFLRLLMLGLFVTTAQKVYSQITPAEAAVQMQKGINLGNTLEPPTEAGWNNPKAQQYYFDLYKEAGFDCIRIPVRWDNYTAKTFPYKVNEAWLNRVEEIVDWGLSRGLFIVINAHHDNWIKENYSNAGYRERFDSIWSQVSVRFKNKSEKLFFEILNEPTTDVKGLTIAENNEIHARILSIIRKTNPTRIVIFQGHNWGGSDELLQAAIPDDDYVMGSFHSYDPYLFGLKGEGTWGSESDIAWLRNKFLAVKNWSGQNHVPVFLGEFGSLRSCDYNSRMKHYKYYVSLAREFGFVSCAWDDGGDFRIMERQAKYWDEVKDILIYSSPQSPDNLKLQVFQDSMIKVSWFNMVSANDSIFIERRKSSDQGYKKVGAVAGGESVFYDSKPDTNYTYHYRVIAQYNDSAGIYSYPQRIFFPGYKIPAQEFYLDEPAQIPGKVEAENFDKGGEGVAYHDSDYKNDGGSYRTDEAVDIFNSGGKYFVFNALAGEWYEYTVDVNEERIYDIEANIATTVGGGKFLIKIGDVESDTLTTAASGSWTNTVSLKTSMKLDAGQQVMRISIVSSPTFNIDNLIFSPKTGSPSLKTDDIFLVYQPLGQQNLIVKVNAPGLINKIYLYSLNGAVIQIAIHPDIEANINISSIPKGIYILEAFSEGRKYQKKISLQ